MGMASMTGSAESGSPEIGLSISAKPSHDCRLCCF
jgi:hypothetical protein